MTDAERRLENLVEKLFDKFDLLNEGHSEIKAILREDKRDREHIAKQVSSVHEAVFGNGKPEHGLAARVPKLESAEQSRKWLIAVVVVAVITSAAKVALEIATS